MSIEFNTKTVSPNIKTNVFSFTNSTGADIFIDAVGGEGAGRAEWFFYINAVLKIKRRNNASKINIDVDFKKFKLLNTDTITVDLIQYEETDQDFSVEMRYSP